jgi:hypothetical protein
MTGFVAAAAALWESGAVAAAPTPDAPAAWPFAPPPAPRRWRDENLAPELLAFQEKARSFMPAPDPRPLQARTARQATEAAALDMPVGESDAPIGDDMRPREESLGAQKNSPSSEDASVNENRGPIASAAPVEKAAAPANAVSLPRNDADIENEDKPAPAENAAPKVGSAPARPGSLAARTEPDEPAARAEPKEPAALTNQQEPAALTNQEEPAALTSHEEPAAPVLVPKVVRPARPASPPIVGPGGVRRITSIVQPILVPPSPPCSPLQSSSPPSLSPHQPASTTSIALPPVPESSPPTYIDLSDDLTHDQDDDGDRPGRQRAGSPTGDRSPYPETPPAFASPPAVSHPSVAHPDAPSSPVPSPPSRQSHNLQEAQAAKRTQPTASEVATSALSRMASTPTVHPRPMSDDSSSLPDEFGDVPTASPGPEPYRPDFPTSSTLPSTPLASLANESSSSPTTATTDEGEPDDTDDDVGSALNSSFDYSSADDRGSEPFYPDDDFVPQPSDTPARPPNQASSSPFATSNSASNQQRKNNPSYYRKPAQALVPGLSALTGDGGEDGMSCTPVDLLPDNPRSRSAMILSPQLFPKPALPIVAVLGAENLVGSHIVLDILKRRTRRVRAVVACLATSSFLACMPEAELLLEVVEVDLGHRSAEIPLRKLSNSAVSPHRPYKFLDLLNRANVAITMQSSAFICSFD